MKKRLLILGSLLVIVAAMLAAGVTMLGGRMRLEPRLEGRPLSDWIRDIVMRHDAERAREVLQDSGTNQVPLLVQWAIEPGPLRPSLKSQLIDACNREIGWLRARGLTGIKFIRRGKYNLDLDHQTLGQCALPELGPAGKAAAIRELIPLLASTNEDTVGNACFILSRMTPDSIEPLIAVLKGGTGQTREIAAFTLGMMGTNAAPAIPALQKMLSDPSLSVRMQAATTLSEAGVNPLSFAPALMQVLADMKNPETLYAVLNQAMQQYSQGANPARATPPKESIVPKNAAFSTNATNTAVR